MFNEENENNPADLFLFLSLTYITTQTHGYIINNNIPLITQTHTHTHMNTHTDYLFTFQTRRMRKKIIKKKIHRIFKAKIECVLGV